MENCAEHSDGELAAAAAAGDLAAFEGLVGRFQQLLYRDALGYLGAHDDALDAVQEALVGALKGFYQLREPPKVGPWLRSAVRRRSLNMLRGRRRRTEAHARFGEAVPEGPSAEQTLAEPTEYLLSGLPPASARAFLLHYVDGLPLSEVARQMDSKPSSVKQRLYRARRHLQREALTMAKEQGDKLPDDFNAHVVAHLLKSGFDERSRLGYEAAKARFGEVLAIEPQHPVALFEWGRTYDPFNWPEADQVGALERAAQAAPDSVEVLAELEIAYRQPGYEAQHQALTERLVALLERRLAADGADVEALRSKARLLMGQGDFTQALPLWAVALQAAPADQGVHYQYGLCLGRLGRRDEAVAAYRAVLDQGGETFWVFCAHRQLATHLAYRADDIEAALEHMEAGWRLSGWANERGNLIYFYSGAGRLKEAVSLFEEAPEEVYAPRVYATVGVGYMEAGHWNKAARLLALAVEKTPDANLAAELCLHWARCAFELGRGGAGDEQLQKGLSLDVEQRGGLAGPKPGSFWRHWTGWLAATLEVLAAEGVEVDPLLIRVRRQLDA